METSQPTRMRGVATSALVVTLVSLALWLVVDRLFPQAPPTTGETAVLVLFVVAGLALARWAVGRLRRPPRVERSDVGERARGDDSREG